MSIESLDMSNFEEHRRNVANAELAEVARDTIDLLSRRIMPIVFERVQAALDKDREELDLSEPNANQPAIFARIYVTQDMIDAPSRAGNFQGTLTLLLGSETDTAAGLDEALRIYMPTNRDNYSYPDALSPEEDMPGELYFDYMPYGKEGIDNQRFVIKEDLLDPKNRYRIFKYDSSADGVEEHVYDTISDFRGPVDVATFERFRRGLPDDTNTAVWLLGLMAHLPESIQKEISTRPE